MSMTHKRPKPKVVFVAGASTLSSKHYGDVEDIIIAYDVILTGMLNLAFK